MMQKRTIPFGTITITDTAKRLIAESVESKRISCGKLVREFEDRFAELLGVKEAVAVSTGTDADILALAILHDFGAQRGDEVIVPALSFVATGNAVVHAGFTPVFVDIERDTLNIDPTKIEAAITPRTRAIMPVHLMGKPAEMDTINAIAKKHNLLVVEDAAEAHGALYKGKPAGNLADLAAFSTYVAHIITTGEGGVITTNHEEYGEILRSLRSHGRNCTCKRCVMNVDTVTYCAKRFRGEGGEDVRFTFDRIGYSCKMNELEAAIGIGAMEVYHEILKKRHDNLLYVLERFDRFAPWLSTIKGEKHEQIGPHAIPFIVNEGAPFTRAELTQTPGEERYRDPHPLRLHADPVSRFRVYGVQAGAVPRGRIHGHNGIHIGVHQDVGIEDMEYVLEKLVAFIKLYQK